MASTIPNCVWGNRANRRWGNPVQRKECNAKTPRVQMCSVRRSVKRKRVVVCATACNSVFEPNAAEGECQPVIPLTNELIITVRVQPNRHLSQVVGISPV